MGDQGNLFEERMPVRFAVRGSVPRLSVPRREPPQTSRAIDIQRPLPREAHKAIAEGMAMADAGANELWKAAFRTLILDVAHRMDFFTVDDLLDEADAHPLPANTGNLSAIGPLVREAVRNGVIVFTGRVQRSRRAVKHGITHRIWQSQVRGKAAA